MKSEAQTKYDKKVADRLSILIALWVLYKLMMVAMLLILK